MCPYNKRINTWWMITVFFLILYIVPSVNMLIVKDKKEVRKEGRKAKTVFSRCDTVRQSDNFFFCTLLEKNGGYYWHYVFSIVRMCCVHWSRSCLFVCLFSFSFDLLFFHSSRESLNVWSPACAKVRLNLLCVCVCKCIA